MIVRFLPEHCASDSNAAEQKSKSALFSLIVLLPRGRGSVSQSGGSSLELETKVAEDYAKITRSVTITEREGAFNQEKVLVVGAFSVITNLRVDIRFKL